MTKEELDEITLDEKRRAEAEEMEADEQMPPDEDY
jgi:hypothetical protein